jgi:hypothetical protein
MFCKKGRRLQCKIQDVAVPGEEIIHKIVNTLRHTGLLLQKKKKKEMTQDTECLLKKNRVKTVLGLNILFGISSNTLNMRQGFQNG